MKIVKATTLFLFVLVFWANAVLAQTTGPDAIIGTYQSKKTNVEIQITKKGNQYFGTVVSGNDKVATGTTLLKNLIYKDRSWKGKVFAPARNSDFDCILTLPDVKSLKLTAKAGLVSRSQDWVRVN